jgi:hypothetical protein
LFSTDGELTYCSDVEQLCNTWAVHTTLTNGNFVDSPKFQDGAATEQKYSPVSTDCPFCPQEGNLQEYGFTLESCKLLKILDGRYVETLKPLDYSKVCRLATQSFAAFFVNGTAEQKANITKLRIGPVRKLNSRGKLSEINH